MNSTPNQVGNTGHVNKPETELKNLPVVWKIHGMVNEESGTSKRRRAPLIYPCGAPLVTGMSTQLITQVRTIPISRRRLTKVGNRFLIQLPISLNNIWEEWHQKGAVVNVIVELVDYKPRQKQVVEHD